MNYIPSSLPLPPEPSPPAPPLPFPQNLLLQRLHSPEPETQKPRTHHDHLHLHLPRTQNPHHSEASPLILPSPITDPNKIDFEAGPGEQIQCRICLETDWEIEFEKWARKGTNPLPNSDLGICLEPASFLVIFLFVLFVISFCVCLGRFLGPVGFAVPIGM